MEYLEDGSPGVNFLEALEYFTTVGCNPIQVKILELFISGTARHDLGSALGISHQSLAFHLKSLRSLVRGLGELGGYAMDEDQDLKDFLKW